MTRVLQQLLAREQQTWERLCARTPHYALILQWARASRLLSRADCYRLGWPATTPLRTRQYGVQQLVRRQWLEPVGARQILVQLGPAGAALLTAEGYLSHYRSPPHPSTHASLTLASAWAVTLACGLWQQAVPLHLAWSATPFQGCGARPDGVGTLSTSPPGADPRARWPETPTAWPLRTLLLEVDRGSERRQALQQRMQQWAQALAQGSGWTCPLLVWLTTRSVQRLRTLHALWTATLPGKAALFTTTRHLTGPDGQLDALGGMYLTGTGTWEPGLACLLHDI